MASTCDENNPNNVLVTNTSLSLTFRCHQHQCRPATVAVNFGRGLRVVIIDQSFANQSVDDGPSSSKSEKLNGSFHGDLIYKSDTLRQSNLYLSAFL